jgi:hypothetical protein
MKLFDCRGKHADSTAQRLQFIAELIDCMPESVDILDIIALRSRLWHELILDK